MKFLLFRVFLALLLCVGSILILRGKGSELAFVGIFLAGIGSLVIAIWLLPPLLCLSKTAAKYSIPASIPIALFGMILIMLSGREALLALVGTYTIFGGSFGLSAAGFVVNNPNEDFCHSLHASSD